jgi:hypothetical protein
VGCLQAAFQEHEYRLAELADNSERLAEEVRHRPMRGVHLHTAATVATIVVPTSDATAGAAMELAAHPRVPLAGRA